MSEPIDCLALVRAPRRLADDEAMLLADMEPGPALMRAAATRRDWAFGDRVTYSRKVFIPLTQLCRDACHYCTFAHPPRRGEAAYLTPDEVLAIARAGAAAGCQEALFTLGDKPELRYRVAREELDRLGHATTLDYLAAMADLVRRETGLLPHLNAGVMTADDIATLRVVSVSQGLMLETASDRLSQRGGAHFGSPDKRPSVRLATIAAAGEAAVPFTSGILIGIGETRRERIEALLALRALHERYGHLQEIIVQNFRAKPGTRMAAHPEPDAAEHLWSVAAARLIMSDDVAVQAPPNLGSGYLRGLLAAGVDDWGGVSPVTPDHVNPEKPWPHLDALARETAAVGKVLVPRLAVHRRFLADRARWIDKGLHTAVLRASDSEGFARAEAWTPGASLPLPAMPAIGPRVGSLSPILLRATRREELSEADIGALFGARGEAFSEVCAAADALRRETNGDTVSYIVTRNVNYTNICSYRCSFCAFSKGKTADHLRGRPYELEIPDVVARCREAWERGAVEVCLQGGIHPDYTGAFYLELCRAIKAELPDLHIHAFSPLETFQGAKTLDLTPSEFLPMLRDAGLGTLPGTAAEVLDPEVRAIICPDKVTVEQWLHVVESAHRAGLRTTATIMFGHVDTPRHWARHLLHLRRLQERTGGITEFVPLPFVAMESPINLRGQSRLGPTFRESVLMHAVSRIVFHGLIENIQTSWVKMGTEGAQVCLNAGANDVGGTLMNESITRAAGAAHGQEMTPAALELLIRGIGRTPRQRTTLYGTPRAERIAVSHAASPLPQPETDRAAANG
ncbi:MAG: 5-amino-6-(D-ribitylamino)uracil--L-tyrosine 4-hydroxyphenyl transferase CofH [Rhodoplanes sp.]|uniref:5-amino-6-(D-ribitylamino)uracil--L-tyrosine 4-hydroxyphenyl transferase CofH n=1 Tax=Rhodoplanes sp. TaxID=1968906 RepID=UPI0018320706|nr:5-amino-6-(D-ribitylamino)uracil--L-tyrosine 4-hydroxyphenyl transferase CofH [Rhodoplanes sp.]NVO14838.1 5-amino-6-(D-ribitylamino)uracil--L-tyrosine 4-hydroxyphenyl transferase CofH [Rhodoplanes sp.]